MAIQHGDNFSLYGTTTSLLLNGVYAAAVGLTLSTDPDGISGGHVIKHGGSGQNSEDGLRYVLNSSQPKVGIAQRVWLPSLPSSDAPPAVVLFQWRDVTNTDLFTIIPDSTGRLELRSGSATGTVVYTTPAPVITATGWYHIEACLNHSSTNVTVKVEGVTVINQTVTITSDIAQVFSGVRTSVTSAGFTWYLKDYVVWDGTGSQNNDFLGSVLVTTLAPTADVSLNWTPSTGTTGWNILNAVPPVDTTFISAPYNVSGPPYFPNPYVATIQSLPVQTTSVKAIVTYVRAAKSDGGDGSLQVGIISSPASSPATALGANRPITVAQTYWRDVFELDPKTGSPWLPAAVNLAELQINRTT